MTAAWQDAVTRGSIATLERLLADGADVDAADAHGQTGLMLAAAAGDARVVTWLAAHGASLDVTAKFGLSALMLAVIRGHAETVRALLAAGASTSLRATAAGFAGKTAPDLAAAGGDDAVQAAFGSWSSRPPAPPAPVFVACASWPESARLLTFVPRAPRDCDGDRVAALRVFVRDHRGRELPAARRTVEAHYATFVFSQSSDVTGPASRLLRGPITGDATAVTIQGRPGFLYPQGPEPSPDDPDGRRPALVVWEDNGVHLLLASDELTPTRLVLIAESIAPAEA